VYEDFATAEPDGDDDEAFYPPPDIDPNREDPEDYITDHDLLFGLLPSDKEVMQRKLDRQRAEKERLEEETRAAAARRKKAQMSAQSQVQGNGQSGGQNGQDEDQPPPPPPQHWRKRRRPKKQWS
jgi:hypothetical protein